MTSQEYFQAHTLNEEFVKSNFNLTWTDDTITIPIYGQDKKLLYCKYRHLTGTAKFTFDKGGKAALFCSHKITKHGSVVLCEGEPDAMRLWQEKIPAVTSTSGVTTFSEELAEPLRGKTVYIALDTDEAGQNEIRKYFEVLAKVSAKPLAITLPPEYKDISEFFSKGGSKDFFEILMDEAQTQEEWELAHEPETIKLESNKSLLADNISQEKWLMDRILPYEGFCFIAGPEACGKSFYTLGIAQSVAYGTPWLGQFKPIETGGVIFIDKENTRSRIQKRLKGLGFEDPDEKIWRLRYPEYFEIVDDKGEFTQFVKAIQRHVQRHNVKLIIVDSFTDVMIGNENARDDTQRFFDAFRQLFPGISILVLHHISKPQPGSSKSGGQLFRGSTNINAQIYSGFLVANVPKAINEFTIEQVKAGDAPKLQKFKVNLVSMADQDKPGDSYVSAVKYEGVVEDEDMKTIEAVEVIGQLLDENIEIYREDIRVKCQEKGISDRTAYRALATLTDNGRVESRRADKGNRKVYFRPIENEVKGYNVNNDEDD